MSTNNDIEKYIQSYDKDDRILIGDIIDFIQIEKSGIKGTDWVKKVKSLYPERNDIKDMCIKVAKTFNRYIKRNGDGTYTWVESGDADITDELKEQVAGQVKLTYDTLQFVKDSKDGLSDKEWATMVAKTYRMPLMMAVEYIQHVIHQFNGVIMQNASGKWIYTPKPKIDAMQLFRDIASQKYGAKPDE